MLRFKGVPLLSSPEHPSLPNYNLVFQSRRPCSVGVLLNRRRCLPSVCAAPNFESQARRPKKGGPAPSGDKTRRPSSSSKPGSNNAQQKRGLAPAPVSDGTPARLAKVMAAAGVASRRACEDLIASGEVTVNGQPVTEQGTLVRPGTDQISVKGKPLATSHIGEKYYYFAVNKPKGYICSNSPLIDKQGKRAIDLLEPWLEGWRKENAKKDLLPPRLFTVGRLDVASTGLIFITNDGHWAQKVIHPSSNLTKEYLVLVDRPATKAQVKTMMGGVEIDGVRVMPEEISTLEDTLRLRIVVGEGKKHESGGSSGVFSWEWGGAAAKAWSPGEQLESLHQQNNHDNAQLQLQQPCDGRQSRQQQQQQGCHTNSRPEQRSGAYLGSNEHLSPSSSQQEPQEQQQLQERRLSSQSASASLESSLSNQSFRHQTNKANIAFNGRQTPRSRVGRHHSQASPSPSSYEQAGCCQSTETLQSRPSSSGRFVLLVKDALPSAPLPSFSSAPLILRTPDQPPMWVWNVAAWRLSQALAALDRAAQARGGLHVGRKYRSGVPLRRKRLRRWWEAPHVVQPPVPPCVWRPEEWKSIERAELAQTVAQEKWQQQQQQQQQEQEQRLGASVQREAGVGVWASGAGSVQQYGRDRRARGRLRRVRWQLQQHRWMQQGVLSLSMTRFWWPRRRRQRVLEALGRELTSREDMDWKVRILVASVGLEVLSLKRVRVGGYRIPRSLNFGDYIPLSPTAIKKVTSLKEQEAQAVQQPQKSKFTVKQPQLPPSLL